MVRQIRNGLLIVTCFAHQRTCQKYDFLHLANTEWVSNSWFNPLSLLWATKNTSFKSIFLTKYFFKQHIHLMQPTVCVCCSDRLFGMTFESVRGVTSGVSHDKFSRKWIWIEITASRELRCYPEWRDLKSTVTAELPQIETSSRLIYYFCHNLYRIVRADISISITDLLD